MAKKLLIISVLLIILAGAVWYFFFRAEGLSENGGGGTIIQDLFPFGQRPSGNQGTTGSVPNTNNTSNAGANSGQTANPTAAIARLRQISTVPTAGIVAFDQSGSTFIRYIERATGHIYETSSGKADLRKVSVSTLPKIHEAIWGIDGSKLLIRYTREDSDVIKTVSAKISTSSAPESAIEAIFLPDGIRTISIYGNKVFYFTEDSTGSSGMTANIDGSTKLSVYNSSFSDWISKWTSTTTVTLYSRPSGTDPGVAYILNPVTGSYAKIAGNLRGLAALGNSDGTLALLSYTDGNAPKTSAYDAKSGTITTIGISALIDKCIWSKKEKNVAYCAASSLSPSATYPDDWYKGKISLEDSIWRVDALTGETNEVLNPSAETGSKFDIIDLGLNQSETVLVFRNKNDLTSWRYELVK